MHYKTQSIDRTHRTIILQCSDKVSERLAGRNLSRCKQGGPLHRKIWDHVVSERPAWSDMGRPSHMDIQKSTNSFFIKVLF